MKFLKRWAFILAVALMIPACGGPDSNTDYTAPGEEDQPTAEEMAVIDELNLARANPADYAAKYIQPIASQFSAEYVNECIAEMTAHPALGKLTYARGLWLMAKAHADTQGPTGVIGHDRTDGTSFQENLGKYGTYSAAGENISYGLDNARDIVVQLLVDDGVESRGHRKNILSDSFSSVGVAMSEHTVYRVECVIDFAGGWSDK